MSPIRRALNTLLLVGVAVGLMGASTAYAQGRPPPIGGSSSLVAPTTATLPAKVSIDTMVVHATNAHSQVDSRLASMMPHLQHLSYTGYTVLDSRRDELSPGGEASFTVAGDRRVTVQLIERDGTQARIRVGMYSGSRRLLDTTVSIHRNKSFIVAGPEYEGGVLMLPMTARY